MHNFLKERYYNSKVISNCLYLYHQRVDLDKMEAELALRPNILHNSAYLMMCDVGLKKELGFLFYEDDFVFAPNTPSLLPTIRIQSSFNVIKYRYGIDKPSYISLFNISNTLPQQDVEKDLLYLKIACPGFAFINQTGRFADLFN